MYRSGNPALRGEVFENAIILGGSETMSIQGAVNKTFILLAIVVAGAAWVWGNPAAFLPFLLPAVIGGFIVALITVFKKEWSGITAPIYAAIQGVAIGLISVIFERSYPGIVIQAVSLTFGVLFCLLMAYKSGLIKVTENFRLGIIAATGAIFLIYMVNMIMMIFGMNIPFIHQSGPLGIIFSIVVVTIAALNLVLDFDFIEKGAHLGAPKYMEWFGAFGLMVTLIWLYLEILRLLSKTRGRR